MFSVSFCLNKEVIMKLLNGNEVIAKPYQEEGAEEIVNLIVRNFKEVNVKVMRGSCGCALCHA